MRSIPIPHEVGASHEAVLAFAESAVAGGLDGNIRVVVARDPREGAGVWRPAFGRLDLARSGDPPPTDCQPVGSVRILEERVTGRELVDRLAQAMGGGPFSACGESISGHGMDVVWRAEHCTLDWMDYGTAWPCIVASPNTSIAQRPHLFEIIEDAGPHVAHDGLNSLLCRASGFRFPNGPGRDVRASRFQLVLWDYRGRIDSLLVHDTSVTVSVAPERDPSLKLVGFVSGQRTRKPVAVTAPERTTVTLDEPVLVAKLVLKADGDVVAEGEKDFPYEARVAALEGRAVVPDPCSFILEAIERSLRPAFDARPNSEKEVQREVEKILRAIGVEFHREKERAPLGATSFIPDFTVPDFGLAIEVKLAKEGHTEAAIQRELAEDAAGYGTRWEQLIVVVYDRDGVVRDPVQMEEANRQLAIRLLVVKH